MPKIVAGRYYHFSVSFPFSEGHVLSKEEAQALNVLRAKNIRKRIESRVTSLHNSKKVNVLSLEDTRDLERWVAEVDLTYSFQFHNLPNKQSLIEIEKDLIMTEEGNSFSFSQDELEEEARRRLSKRDVAVSPNLFSIGEE